MPDPIEPMVDDIVRRIIKTVQPTRIVLFGSAARGTFHDDGHDTSDLDFLVIMPAGTHRRDTARAIERALREVGIPKDVVVVTEDDVITHRDNPSLVIKPALDEGREVYAA